LPLDSPAFTTRRSSDLSYYLAGYAVECALKSCVLARVALEPELIFNEQNYQKKCWTHNIEELVKLAGLETERQRDVRANVDLGADRKSTRLNSSHVAIS